jgi:hypothetical protein
MADWGDATHMPMSTGCRDNRYPDSFDLFNLFIARNFSQTSRVHTLSLCVEWQTSRTALRSILWH